MDNKHLQCQVCEGESHHWRENSIDPTDTAEVERIVELLGYKPDDEFLIAHFTCAHCPAVMALEDGEDWSITAQDLVSEFDFR